MVKIPLTKPVFDDHEIEMVKKCLDSGWVTQGPLVAQFEEQFAMKHKVKFAYAVNSCTSALHLAALAIGLKEGQEAIVPAFTWVTSANCIEYTGAKAVFVDVDPGTFNIDPKKIEAAITSKTKAIVVVHLFGLSAQMDEIMRIAKKHDLKVIEDCACAFATLHDKTPVGGIGDIGCFSFHPRKSITTGEGGMMTTNDPVIASTVNSLRNHGCTSHPSKPGPNAMNKPYEMSGVDKIGYNFRMPDILAAIGLAQLDKADMLIAERIAIAQSYNDMLTDIAGITIPCVPAGCHHTYQSYVIRINGPDAHEKRNRIMDLLAAEEVWTRPGTHAVHRLDVYAKKYGICANDFPAASLCEDTSITLPIFHGMPNSDQEFVVNIIKKDLEC